MSGSILAVNGIGEEPLVWDTTLAMSMVMMVAAAVFGGLDSFWRETDCQVYDLNVSARAVNRCCSAATRQLPFFATLALVNAVTFVGILLYIRVHGQVQQLRQAIVNEKQLLHSTYDHLLRKKLEQKLAGEGKDKESGETVDPDQAFAFFDAAAPASEPSYGMFQAGVTYQPEHAKRLNLAVVFGLSVVAISILTIGIPPPLLCALGTRNAYGYESFQCGLEQCFPANHSRAVIAPLSMTSPFVLAPIMHKYDPPPGTDSTEQALSGVWRRIPLHMARDQIQMGTAALLVQAMLMLMISLPNPPVCPMCGRENGDHDPRCIVTR